MGWSKSHDWVTRGHIRTWLPLIVLWSIWKARNEAKHKNRAMKAENIIYCAERKIQNITNAKPLKKSQLKGEDNIYSRGIQQDNRNAKTKIITFRWSPPDLQYLKLNLDGCSRGNPGPSAAGGLLRNSKGKVLFTFSINLGINTAYMAELLAVKEGLNICISKQINFVWLEMDSQMIVNQINENYLGNWQSAEIFREIRSALSHTSWICTHIFREANTAADALANHGLTLAPFDRNLAEEAQGRVKGITMLEGAGIKTFRII